MPTYSIATEDNYTLDIDIVDSPTYPLTAAGPAGVSVSVPGPQGPGNLHVGPTNELTPGHAGLWVQTGIGPEGQGFTFWIEDGV